MRKEMKRTVSWVLIFAIAAAMIGCASRSGVAADPAETGAATGALIQAPDNSEIAGGKRPTVKCTVPTSEVDVPSSEEMQPALESTEATESTILETDPEPTDPKPTNPKPTDPKPTEPKPTVHTHSYTETAAAPTCTSDGYTLHKCSCGDSYKDHVTAALGHSFGDWVTAKEVTVSEAGQQRRTCSRCGVTETKPVAKLPGAALDLDEAMQVGNEYAVSRYGWIVDYSLNADNAGYDFPSSLSLEYYQEKGQERLNQEVRDFVDHLYDAFMSSYGYADGVRVNCHVYYTYWDGQTFIDIAVFYG